MDPISPPSRAPTSAQMISHSIGAVPLAVLADSSRRAWMDPTGLCEELTKLT